MTHKTSHYSINYDYFPGYVMFSYFRFVDSQLFIGQSELVPLSELEIVLAALKKNGRTEAGYRYVSGKAVLVQKK